jgi:16S rRNA (cytidine1402-2'-O)-methyltransferase
MASGILYIIATPLGNLEDITLRALRILGEADLVAAEDTRKTRILLHHYNIKKPLTSYFEHNERFKTATLITLLQQGKSIALVSEAGTPGISDPGYRIVSEALLQGIAVITVPGPCAAIAALSVAGLPVHRFAFEGFLPPKSGKRKNVLKKIAGDERTLIFYESPHRIVAAISDMIETLGDRRAVLARELTKLHEETLHGGLSEIAQKLQTSPVRGEITLIVEGCREQPRQQIIDKIS